MPSPLPSLPSLFPRQPNQSLVDGLRVLQFAMMRGGVIGVTEVAEELEMEVTRSHRLLRTLAATGYLRHVKGRKYASGPAVPILAAQSMQATGFAQHIFPILNELHESTGMLLAYGLLWERFVTYLYHAFPDVHGEGAVAGHPLFQATDSRLGLVMLASLEESEVRRIYEGHPTPGFRSMDQLLAKLRSINEKGYNYGITNDKGDHTVAIRFENNPCAAIGIAGKIRSSEAPRWAERLREVTRAIESNQARMDP